MNPQQELLWSLWVEREFGELFLGPPRNGLWGLGHSGFKGFRAVAPLEGIKGS